MTPYWALFFIPLFATVVPLRADRSLRKFLLLFFFIICSILIGLRYRVGGDWSGYIVMFNSVESLNFLSLFCFIRPWIPNS